MEVLRRWGGRETTWVETGSYLGETSSKLAKISKQVHSLEPDVGLFQYVSWRYRNAENLTFYLGTSEQILEDIVKNLQSDISFWLDGHFSGDITFKGELSSPIVNELEIIARYLPNLTNVRVLVDDVRDFVFGSKDESYPSIDYLVSWARKNNLYWTIEHDIFIASYVNCPKELV
jgi:hypothetical protein